MITDRLDDTKSYYELIIKITIFKKRIAKLWKKGKIRIKIPTKEMKNLLPAPTNNKVSNNKLSDNNLARELVEK